MDLNKVEKLPPFKNFFATVGNIPSSYQESMTYFEMLQWFCNYLENTVIPTLNNNGQSVIELQNLFVELHSYVHDYFTNLDVQQEINNKLDTMASDGTLDQLLLPYFNQYKDEINAIVDTQNTSINNIRNTVNNVASGSPKGAYNSVNDLITANPSSGTYVITSTGHIYSFVHGSDNATDLGLYQAVQLSNKSVVPEKLTFTELAETDTNIALPSNYEWLGYNFNADGSHTPFNWPLIKFTKEYIDIENFEYYGNGQASVTFWDANDEYISGFSYQSNETAFVHYNKTKFPSDYSYLIFSLISLIPFEKMKLVRFKKVSGIPMYKTSAMCQNTDTIFDLNNTRLSNKNFLPHSISQDILDFNSISTGKLQSATLDPNYNLLEPEKGIVCNFYPANQTTIYDHPTTTAFLFDLDKLDRTQQYSLDFDCSCFFYDENFNYISHKIGNSLVLVNWLNFTLEPDAKYLVIYMLDGVNADKGVFCLTSVKAHNLKAHYLIDNLIPNDVTGIKNYISPLSNKKIIYFGDSWCAGAGGATGGWARRIKEIIPSISKSVNCGRNGADWSQGYGYWFDNAEHYATIDEDFDYIIIEAYTNGLYGSTDNLYKPLGEIDEFTFFNSIAEINSHYSNTFARDLEKFIFSVVNRWAGKKIGLMFPYKSVDMQQENNAFRNFIPQVKKCCAKYNINVLDNFNGSNIPLLTQSQIDQFFYFQPNASHADGVHLNANGTEIIINKILKWIESL